MPPAQTNQNKNQSEIIFSCKMTQAHKYTSTYDDTKSVKTDFF